MACEAKNKVYLQASQKKKQEAKNLYNMKFKGQI